jgi:hypothetical protein
MTATRKDAIAHLYQPIPRGHDWGGSQGHISLPRLVQLHTEEHRDGRVGHEMHDIQPYPAVHVGQVWEDNDRCMARRRLLVDGIGQQWRAGSPDATPIAECKVLGTDPPRFVRIRLDRFRPTSRGYRLVEDAPEETQA